MSRTIQLHTGNQSLITLATSASFAPTILPSGVVSSSSQVIAFLPVGTVSSSRQINTGSFTGSFIGTLSGSTFGTSSWAISSSFATTASNLTGGTANYIPLWASATLQSSSNIYQSAGNVVVGGTSTQAKLTVFAGSDPAVDYGFSVGKYPRQLVMGYHTASNYGFIISTETGVGYQPLALQQFGGNVGIGTTSPANSSKLDVADGKIRAGTITSTNGSTIIEGAYSNGAITTFGTEYSSGGPVLGYGITPSTASADSFFSSTGINANRGAYVMAGGDHKWSSATAASTVTIGTVVSLTENMRLTTPGNLGIGTTTPAAKLDVRGSMLVGTGSVTNTMGATNYIAISTPTIGQSTGLEFYGAASPYNPRAWITHTHTVSSQTLTFNSTFGSGTGYANFIFSNGNVGIGATSPAYKLDVIGNARIGQNSNSSTAARLDITAGGSGFNSFIDFGFYDTFDAGVWYMGRSGSSGAFFINNAGTGTEVNVVTINSSTNNLGIGTITPATKLDVNGGISIGGGQVISASATYTQLIRRDGSVGIYLGGSGDPNNYYDNTNHYFRSITGATTRMIINSAGNVGIGTTNPSSSLTLNASTGQSHGLTMFRSGWSSAFRLGAVSSSGDDFWITSNWNPSTAAQDSSEPGYITLAPKNELRTVIGGTRMTTVTTTGVGIGTTTPSTTLDVNGISTLRGNLLFAPTGAHDIGASGTSRPINVYVSSSILVESSSANGVTTMLKNGFLSLTYGSKTLANWFPASYAGIDYEKGNDALLFAGTSVDITSNIVYDGSAGVRATAGNSAAFSQAASTGWTWQHGGTGASGSAITLSNKMFLDTTGLLRLYNNLEFTVDNSYDIGRTTSFRPRNVYVAGNVSASSYTSSLGFLANGATGYRHTSGSVTALLRANPTTNAVEFGAETFHVVNMTINGSALYQFGVGAFLTTNPLYTLGAAITPWYAVYANNIFSSGSIVHTGSMQIVSGTLAVQSIFEKVTVTASAAPATLNYNILDQAILFHSASSTANWTLNFRGNASTTLNSVMSTGQSLTTTLMVLNTTTAYSASAYQIDGTSITPRWQGGTSGSANSNSLDAHTFTIIKTSATPTYVLLGSITKYS